MNRLTLVATIGAVLVAAILGLIYAVSKQDVDDTPEPTAQTQPAAPAAQPATPPANPAPADNQASGSSEPPAPANPAAGDQGPVPQSTITGATTPEPINPPAAAPAQSAANNEQVASAAAAPAPAVK